MDADIEKTLQALLASKEAASAAAQMARKARDEKTLTRKQLAAHVRSYIAAKFLLDSECIADREMEELAEESLAKLTAIPAGRIERADIPASCSSASSKDMKLAKLYLALRKDFDADVNGMRLALADTADDIANLLWEAYGLDLVDEEAAS
ncbi:hypothetical protein [uncultured Ellagibacter sp.]|uniref:hypothetical protein n=1 Tax=uncultured Ellagibacter sp. TaxID=2137580 RepID=UPI00262C5981|nr:hypothetical protein [uncultured Ellagibacter sp.]